jgi:mannosyltransferase
MNKADTTTIQKFDVSLFINKHKYLIALGVFISYLCLSMYKIGNNSLWYDEGFSIDLAHDSIDSIILSSLRDDPNPPLYIIILHYWISVFGDSETGLRSLSAVAMSLAGSILFLFCRRFFNWQTAIFATLFFFTSNEIYYYSEEGRTFGLIILFCTLSIYSFMNLIKSPNWKTLYFRDF